MQLQASHCVFFGAIFIAVFAAVAHATYCRAPPDLENGSNDASLRRRYFRIGTVVKYRCNDGYRLQGWYYTVCYYRRGQGTYWTRSAPMCIPKNVRADDDTSRSLRSHSDSDSDRSDDSDSTDDERTRCRGLRPPENGQVKFVSTSPGSFAKYFCNPGYSIWGNTFRKCLYGGQWSGAAPICKASQCPKLDDPKNGRVKMMNGRTVGSEVWYICDAGFVLIGMEARTCLSSLEWSSEAPICQPADCGPPERPANGWVKFTMGTRVGASAWYFCKRGFVLKGSESRTCQSSGRWEPEVPVCKQLIANCDDLDDPAFGSVKLSGTAVGSIARYSCIDGYQLSGESNRVCQPNGDWSGKAPTCKRTFTCEELDDPENGMVQITGRTLGSFAKYTCNKGYLLFGSRFRKCIKTGWSGEAPVCKPVQCGDLPQPKFGSVELTGTTFGSTATYSCLTGYLLKKGNTTRVCQANGVWSGVEPICIPVDCGPLDPPMDGSVTLTGTVFGSVATYSCNDGFRLEGEETRECQANSLWSGRAPTCTPEDVTCEDLQDPSNGRVELSGNTPGSTAEYSCNSGYRLVGTQSRTCQDDGFWSDEEPICELVTCPQLDNPQNGRVSVDGQTVGSTANYDCDVGFEPSGSLTRVCMQDGQWSGEEPSCIPVDCGNLPNPTNGRVDLTGTTFGSVAAYSCNADFVLEGQETRECQANMEWSGTAPKCIPVPVDCGPLDDPDNGRVELTGTTEGSTASYFCFTGYELKGVDTRTCTSDGWSDSEPSCEPVDCGPLPPPVNGDVSLSSTVFGGVATYSCSAGYILVGERTRECQATGWSGEEPVCEPVDCGPLDNPDNGRVELTGTTEGSTASYFCFTGYELKGVDTRTCTIDGWSDSEPSCEPVDCGPLLPPVNGDVSLSSTVFGGVATYSCSAGYILVGERTRECQATGWSGEEPVCEPVDCGPLDDPDNGRVELTGTTEGSTASYFCFTGYELKGVDTRTCTSDGWSDSEPSCEPIDCGPLLPPVNGDVSLSSTVFGGVATYSCSAGYILVGERTRECQVTGWSGEEPVCEPVDCGPLDDPENGQVNVPSTTFRSTASYTCDNGFIIVGVQTRECQGNEEWSDEAPTCEPIQCDLLPDPPNGIVMMMGRDVGSMAMYSCDFGFMLDGDMVRNCQADGEWSGEEPVCKPAVCEELDSPENGNVELSGTTIGSTATYTCDPGYELRGDRERRCQMNRQWSGSAPTCERLFSDVDCGTLPPPPNGCVKFTSTKVRSRASYSCNPGFILLGKFTRVCLINGRWSGREPICVHVPPPAMCPQLVNPANGEVTLTGTTVGSTATYSCNPGYILDGVETRVCQDTGVWSETAPTCEPVDCGPLPPPSDGQIDQPVTTLGGTATYSCNTGFELSGVRTRVCTESGDWSGEAPVCDSITCPDLQDPANGRVTLSGTTFSSTALYECDDGFVLVGDEVRVCQDSGEWTGEDPECIVPLPGCGDPGVPTNGRRIGDNFTVGAVVFFRCDDDFDLIGSKFRLCQENGLWSGTQPICQPFNDTCFEDSDLALDRCGRRCQCSSGRLINCCRVRKDYAGLSSGDRLAYINTVLTVTSDPIYKPRYDSLVAAYRLSFQTDILQSTDPTVSQFFVFVRYFMLEYEDILRDFNCSLTIPFYDWTPFPETPYAAAVWDNEDGFGDTARVEDGCVFTGPFRVGLFEITPSAGGGCLRREYRNQRFPSRDIITRDLLPLPANEFNDFHRFLQLFIGLNVQCFIGGTVCSSDAANDPVFLLHLSQLDSLLTRWQNFGDGRATVRYADDNSVLLFSSGFTVADFSNNLNLPHSVCLLYDPPFLLKNHPPPPTTLNSVGATLSTVRMDCAPSDMMSFMPMSEEDHDFMHEECAKERPSRSIPARK